MNAAKDETCPKMPLALRIGVTGRRKLDSAAILKLQQAVQAALGAARDELAAFAATPTAKAVYRAVPFALRVVSPLAEGADRLVAEAAARMDAQLYFPLPFAQAEYEKDFPKRVDAFRALLAGRETFELDGERDDPAARDESYEAVGRFVVGACDLMLAIWDGKRQRGRGGTGAVVAFAIEVGSPVFWIDETGEGPPKWLRDGVDLADPASAPTGEAALEAMREWIVKTLTPPEAGEPERHGPFGWLAGHLCRRWARDRPPLQDFFAETKLPQRAVWSAYQTMMRLAAPRRGETKAHLATPVGPVELYWHRLLDAPDLAANAYGDRYRSSYVWIALLAVAALGAAALTGDEGMATGRAVLFIEAVAVLGIGFLVTINQTHRWHERWISYRLLAELFRKQFTLSAIGRSLPGSDVARLASELDENKRPPRDVWIAWYFMAALRASPFATGKMTDARARALEVGRSLGAEQKEYHETRRDRCSRAGGRIKSGSELFFCASVLFAAAKFLAVHWKMDAALHVLVLSGAFLSAGAGAFVGLRAYSEFTLLARQSTHMLRALEIAERDLTAAALVVNQPLSSRQIGRAIYSAAGAMMQDINGWAQLFRMKTIEAG